MHYYWKQQLLCSSEKVIPWLIADEMYFIGNGLLKGFLTTTLRSLSRTVTNSSFVCYLLVILFLFILLKVAPWEMYHMATNMMIILKRNVNWGINMGGFNIIIIICTVFIYYFMLSSFSSCVFLSKTVVLWLLLSSISHKRNLFKLGNN